ncbi:MAG: hypothetical protein K2M60_02230 [Lachnospiraceae bacterium]|nr:hypothetical protein [Lachnospiraceae bacterium]MDE6252575.1 hypothetical protein [Lachnospiraceae bacterium]
MDKKKQIRRETKKVSASKYYKGKDIKRISRKERDKQIYRRTRDDGVKVSINNPNNPLVSAVPGIVDKISRDNEDADEHAALSEALRTAMPLSGIQVQVSKKAKKVEDITADEIKKKNSKTILRKDLPDGEKSSSDKNGNNENSIKGRDKKKIIREDIVSDLKKEDKKKNSINPGNKKVMEKNDVVADMKSEDHANDLKSKNGTSQNILKNPPAGKVPEENKEQDKTEQDENLRKRKLAEAAYAGYIQWKREQIKKRKTAPPKANDTKDKTNKENTSKHSSEEKKEEKKDKSPKDDDPESQHKDIKRKSRRKERKSRAVNPLVKNAKRNIAAVKNEVKFMPIRTLRMVTDDISADELAMRTGRGIMGYMSRIYGNAMKMVGALTKSLALLAVEVAKDILIAFAPVLLIAVILCFVVYFIFLSPMQFIMGGGSKEGEEVTVENSYILKAYCSEALLESADKLQQKILTDKPTAAIKIMTISEENLNDMCEIMSFIMALYGAYPDDEDWLKSTEGQEELNKYAGFMCHQLNQSEIDEQKGNQEDETPTEETTTQHITEEPSTEPETEDTETNEIWIGYYSYEYLLETGYLSEIEEFIQ